MQQAGISRQITAFCRSLLSSVVQGVLLASFLSSPTSAQSNTDTWICNATREPLYLTVRHNGASAFSANSRTEGWIRLPTRGIRRSCWVENRRLKDQIVVVGVRRGDEIVPVNMSARGVSRSRPHSICVKKFAVSFQYEGSSRSDTSCPQGFILARASFVVHDGKGRVDLDLSGPINVAMTPEQSRQAEEARKREAARRAQERKRQREAEIREEQEAVRRERLLRMSDFQFIGAARAHIEKRHAGKAEEILENSRIWSAFLLNKVFRIDDGKSSLWIGLKDVQEDGAPYAIIMQTDPGENPPDYFWHATASSVQDPLAYLPKLSVLEEHPWEPVVPGLLTGNLTRVVKGPGARSPLVNEDARLVYTPYMFSYLPDHSEGKFGDRYSPTLCFQGSDRYHEDKLSAEAGCFSLFNYKAEGGDGISLKFLGGLQPKYLSGYKARPHPVTYYRR